MSSSSNMEGCLRKLSPSRVANVCVTGSTAVPISFIQR
jgi:hypothetical protein